MTLFFTAYQKLRLQNVVERTLFKGALGMKMEVPEGMPIAIVSPEIQTQIDILLAGKDTVLGDKVNRNGYSGFFGNFNVFVSNSLPSTFELALATKPTDGDTIVINGVTWTFKTTLAAAGQLLIGASAATANDAVVAAINNSESLAASTEGTLYWNVTDANRDKLANITATDGTTKTTFVSGGWGTVPVSETLIDVTDTFTAVKQQVHNIFALSKSISLVVQKNPSLEENFVSGKVARDYIAWTVYGYKVFRDQAFQIVELAVNSSTFTGAATTL